MCDEWLSDVEVVAPDRGDSLVHLGIDIRELGRRVCRWPDGAEADDLGVRELGTQYREGAGRCREQLGVRVFQVVAAALNDYEIRVEGGGRTDYVDEGIAALRRVAEVDKSGTITGEGREVPAVGG